MVNTALITQVFPPHIYKMFNILQKSSKITLGLIGGIAAPAVLSNPKKGAAPLETDVVVVGGGVVGLACARECAVRGRSVILLEKEGCVAGGATSGNSGLGCTGYDAPRGSLESRLLRRSIERHQNLYRSFGLSHEHVRKCGSVVVAWTPEEVEALEDVLV